jgi:tripartite-type tricarboxylate transporter receptor subunit TctC
MNASLKILAVGALCGLSADTLAQNYPLKPVRIMVGVAPGGGVDTTARMVGQALGELWGTQVIVENRPGAVGMVATEFTAKAPPDGYTLILCNIATHCDHPGTLRHEGPLRSLSAICISVDDWRRSPICSWCIRRFP